MFNENAILWICFELGPSWLKVVFAPAAEINTQTKKSYTTSVIYENTGQKTPLFVPKYGLKSIKQTQNLNIYKDKPFDNVFVTFCLKLDNWMRIFYIPSHCDVLNWLPVIVMFN